MNRIDRILSRIDELETLATSVSGDVQLHEARYTDGLTTPVSVPVTSGMVSDAIIREVEALTSAAQEILLELAEKVGI